MGWSIDERRPGLAARLLAVGASWCLGACGFDFGGVVYEDAASTTSTSTGATSTGPAGGGGATATSTGSGAQGGGGSGPVACGDVECPVIECYETSCSGDDCVLSPLEAGAPCGPEGAQTCTESQDCVACAEVEDCSPPLSSCRTVACVEGACVESALRERSPCVGEEGVCTAAQACVECIDQAECEADQVCVEGACTTPAATCFDRAQNAGETGIDCGGSCPPCANGLGCATGDDCQSGYCNGTTCAPCSTVSCGAGTWCNAGVCIPQNGDGVPCSAGGECASGSCVDGVCCNDPCNGTCSSCRAADTGSADGLCAPILVGADPGFECAEGECLTGACNGAGQCGFAVGECSGVCNVTANGDVAYASPGTCTGGECAHLAVSMCPTPKCNPEGTDCAQ